MTDTIEILGVRGYGHHGVLAAERTDGQEFTVDVTLRVSTRAASASDDLADTVNYADIAERVHAHITGKPCALIETLAERIASDVLAASGVEWVEIAVHKPSAPIPVPFDDVIVRIQRP